MDSLLSIVQMPRGVPVATLAIGDEVIAYVLNPEGHDGSAVLSIDRARGEQGWRVLEQATEVEETVTGAPKEVPPSVDFNRIIPLEKAP